MEKLKIIHYINQFYAGIGGEEKADEPPQLIKGPVGPGIALQAALGESGDIVATVVCGDSTYTEKMDETRERIKELVKPFNFDMIIAGPAFNAGRYGVACGDVASFLQKELGVFALTGMYPENPGVDLYKKELYILETKNSAADMRKAIKKMATFALRMKQNDVIEGYKEEGYIKRGLRRNYFNDKRGSERAVDMLISKMNQRPYETEYSMPEFDRVKPGNSIKDLTKAKIAIVTSGGIVPKGNPDHIESSSASKYGKYSIKEFNNLSNMDHETAHGGYDPIFANEDADRVVPVDVLRDLEKEGKIGKLHPYFYSTTGNGTAVASAKKFATDIALDLKENKVDAVILTST